MEKNKIDGIKPFNDFFFKSCYYHQLLAGIACFGIERDAVLLNSFTFIKRNFNAVKEDIFNQKKLGKLLGYKIKHCNINKIKLIRNIDKGNPIIMGIDCYYLESRPDTYQIQHTLHFILAYGYDLHNKEANVIDHQYVNSYEYIEKIVSLENLLLANMMLNKGILKRRRSCYILKRTRNNKTFDIWQYIDDKKINDNRENSLANLNELRRMFGCDLESVRENVENITEYLNELRTFYYTLSKTGIFIANREKQETAMFLASAYSNVLSLFWKLRVQNNYDYVTKRLDSILRKIDEIESLEKIVYDFLLEVRKKQ